MFFLLSARAGPIVYQIAPRFPQGPVLLTGTITTDGAIGPLAASDILAWSFLLQDTQDTRTALLSSATGSVRVTGSNLVASATALTFLFVDPVFQYFVAFTEPPNVSGDASSWGFGSRALFNGIGSENILSTSGYSDFAFRFAAEVIGTALPTSVPEPPLAALLAVGVACGLLARTKRSG